MPAEGAQKDVLICKQYQNAVFSPEGIRRPFPRKRLAPAYGPAGDSDDLEASVFQGTQCGHCLGRDGTFSGQDAGDPAARGQRPIFDSTYPKTIACP